ncbi:MAG: hypothetical protein RR131_07430 [Anaerovorax sp.]
MADNFEKTIDSHIVVYPEAILICVLKESLPSFATGVLFKAIRFFLSSACGAYTAVTSTFPSTIKE